MEQKEFYTIFTSLKDKVFRYARAILSDVEEAEDVTQDIFERLLLNKNSVLEFNNVESYLIRSTKNLCLDRVKHRNVVLKNSENIKNLSNHVVEPELEQKEMAGMIRTIIDRLPKKQKMIIHLRDVESYNFDEIFDATGIDPNAIRVNLSRARKTVKEELIKTMNYGL
ncbi:MAG: sigma-70 family RNA polymerase sigma factor [Bacteroidales bacterium]|nr:sigma-70 family RNA polymerase sigma factor [Bacteroidales bacterium]